MNIEIYTLDYCPFCKKAKAFFDEKNIPYVEYKLNGDEDEEFRKLQKKYDIKNEVTVPQIVINGKRIGGYSDLTALYEAGKLKF